jgi:hypothetical protein
VSHDIGIHLRSPCKQDLASNWEAVRIFDTGQVSSGVAYAIENGFGTLTEECMIQMRNFASEELNAQTLKLAFQILNVSRCIYGHCGE